MIRPPRWIFFFAIMGSLLVLPLAQQETLLQYSNQGEDIDVEINLSLYGLSAAGFLLAFLIVARQRKTGDARLYPVYIWERLVATFLDMAVIGIILTNVAGFIMIWMEAQYTQEFNWRFQRDFTRDTDWIGTLAVLSAWFVIPVFYYVHNRVHVSTPGQYVVGYRVVPTENEAKPLLRALLAIVGLFVWPFSLYGAAKDKEKLFWWDKLSNSRPVRTLVE
ncbi:RDD family protein [Parvularcula flava]|uniref:RDD family protein n=1 Tax=Aquisalinus luteolus TaxID=1566827 RepID=A0ABX0HS12_9PROT|nr:RDD family protein [Aquisalinus luteolus]NHK29364.1 RDD family protein [Aquisalinus luteolus]